MAIQTITSSRPSPGAGAPLVEQHFLGRQPILDHGLNLYGFDLLFRSARENTATPAQAVTATANVVNTILHTPDLLGTYKGYIHVDETLLMSQVLQLLPSEKIGLEVSSSLQAVEATIARCRHLRELGFELVLDDYRPADKQLEALLQVVNMVKVDFTSLDATRLAGTMGELRRRSIKVLVKNLENHEDVAKCKQLNVHLYQGYFFARPKAVSGKRFTHSELALLKLMGLVEADADTCAVENALKEEPSLTIDLLRLSNSAAISSQQPITSIGHAIMMLGRQQIKRWLQLLTFARLAPGSSFPSPLLQLAATRARFMELAVEDLEPQDKGLGGRAFLTGLLSLMGVLLGQSIQAVLAQVDVEEDIRDAVLGHEGLLGALLLIAESWEREDDGGCAQACKRVAGLTTARINQAQIAAFAWSNNLGNAVP